MPIPGQPAASPSLVEAVDLLARGHADEAEALVTKAAKKAKAQYGSGSHPLACAYADMGRLHYQMGSFKRAAVEFRHAAESPMPSEPAERADRLAMMFGYAACLEALDRPLEAEKVYRQCVEFARALHGPTAALYATAILPLAELLLKTGPVSEAVRILDEAYGILWRVGDPAIVPAAVMRAEGFKMVGRGDDPFADLIDLPDEMAIEIVAAIVTRSACGGDGLKARSVLADLLRFVDRRFGDGHAALADTLAATTHSEAALGDRGDLKLRTTAARRAIWTFTKSRAPKGVLESIEIGFEPDGTIHLVPRLAREPDANESVLLEMVLTQAVDDLYARPRKPTND
jgi:tetratricopeptide (TPR) repeat protein